MTTLGLITTATIVPALLTGMPPFEGQRVVAPHNYAQTDAVLHATRSATEIDTTCLTNAAVNPLDSLLSKAAEYACLTDGWDGPNSKAPSAGSLQAAQTFIAKLPGGLPLPGIMVSYDGEIGFYWDLDGGYADISFSSAGRGSFFSRTLAGAEEFEDDLSLDDLDRAWFFHRLGAMAAPVRAAA